MDCSERNGFIDSYFVMYQDLLNMDVRSKRVHVLETVLMGLLPSTVYNISLAASNMDGMGPYINLSVETTELHPTTESMEISFTFERYSFICMFVSFIHKIFFPLIQTLSTQQTLHTQVLHPHSVVLLAFSHRSTV